MNYKTIIYNHDDKQELSISNRNNKIVFKIDNIFGDQKTQAGIDMNKKEIEQIIVELQNMIEEIN